MILNITDITIEGVIYKRKLDIEGTFFRLKDNKIEIPADIIYYSQTDVELGRNIFNSKKINSRTGQKTFETAKTVIFVVDNETKVNPANGAYDPASTIGEYDYYMYLLNNMDILVANNIKSLEGEVLPNAINNAINYGRLDYE